MAKNHSARATMRKVTEATAPVVPIAPAASGFWAWLPKPSDAVIQHAVTAIVSMIGSVIMAWMFHQNSLGWIDKKAADINTSVAAHGEQIDKLYKVTGTTMPQPLNYPNAAPK